MSDKCPKCTKTVYPMEQQIYDSQKYHKGCFKCQMCKSSMSISNVAKINSILYCKPCFKKTFKSSGGSYATLDPHGIAKNASQRDLSAIEKAKTLNADVLNTQTTATATPAEVTE